MANDPNTASQEEVDRVLELARELEKRVDGAFAGARAESQPKLNTIKAGLKAFIEMLEHDEELGLAMIRRLMERISAQFDKFKSRTTLYCSFCGKSQHEVKKLIAGPTVFICNECTLLCMGIISQDIEGPLEAGSPDAEE